MRRFLVFAALVLAARDASASSCNALVPHVVTPEIPLGCPLVAYVSQKLTSFSPLVERERAGLEYGACDGTYMPDDPEDPDQPEDPADPHAHDHGGCSAGGGLSLAAALLLLGLRRRRG